MAESTKITIDCENFEEVINFINNDLNFEEKLERTIFQVQSFHIIKITITILYTLADIEDENSEKSTFPLFKKTFNKILEKGIKPLINKIISTNASSNEMSKHVLV